AGVRPDGQAEAIMCTRTTVSASYFGVLGIPIIAGRTFSDDETQQTVPVAVISEGLAARFWHTKDVLGRRLTIEAVPFPVTIVGVVRDTSSTSLWREKEM